MNGGHMLVSEENNEVGEKSKHRDSFRLRLATPTLAHAL